MKTVSILGCGWYGRALAIALIKEDWKVKGSTTAVPKLQQLQRDGIDPYLVDLGSAELPEQFFDTDVLIIASNVKLAQRPNYLAEIERLVDCINKHRIQKVIFISSVSVYGEPNREVDEHTIPAPATTSAQLLYQAENLLSSKANADVTILRFGGLIGPGRLPGKFLAGKSGIANGLAPVNLIHLTDCIGLTKSVINCLQPIQCLNGVHPDHPTRYEFYTQAATREGLPLPDFILDKTDWKIVRSIYPESFYSYQQTIS